MFERGLADGSARLSTWRVKGVPARAGVAAAVLLALVSAGACGDSVDVAQALKVTDAVTGWYDAGVVNGKNKLVPSISFRVKNTAASAVHSVQLNAVFRVIDDPQELGSMLARGIGPGGLAPGATTEAYVLRSALGYTGEQPRMQMLQHDKFRDAKVEVFAKHGSKQWVKLAEFKVERQLLTH